jgi:cytoskeletal protein CcmA (bactofilin family)
MASRIVVAGKVSGNIYAYERVELLASALVQGDIKYASMAVEHGARLLGLMLQIEGNELPANLGRDATAAIHKAKTTKQSD